MSEAKKALAWSIDGASVLLGIAVLTIGLGWLEGWPGVVLECWWCGLVGAFNWFVAGDVPVMVWVVVCCGVGVPTLLIAFNPLHQQVPGKYGDARWALVSDVKAMGLWAKRGLPLGLFGRRVLRLDQPLSVLVLAPPGTGKTAGLAIPMLLMTEHSFLVLDVKGELYDLTSKRRSEFSRVLRFAPGDSSSIGWNPLAREVLPDTLAGAESRVRQIADALIKAEKGRSDDFWIKSAREMFTFAALALIHGKGETSLPEIYRTLTHPDNTTEENIRLLTEMMNFEDEGLPQNVIGKGLSIASYPEAQFSGIFGSLESCLGVFSDESLAGALEYNSFEFLEFRDKPTTLYVCVKDRDLSRLKSVIRLFFELSAAEYMSEKGGPGSQRITFLLDEFVRLGTLDDIRNMPAVSRGMNVNVVLIAQDWGQIKELYGADGASSIEGTMGYLVVLTQNNYDAAKRISDMIGQRTSDRHSISRQEGKFSKNVSTNQEGRALILAQELRSLRFGTGLISAQFFGDRPIKIKMLFWFKNRRLKKMGGCVEVIDSNIGAGTEAAA